MIQRKQTLYLLAIFALIIAMLFMPLATLTVGGTTPTTNIETAADGTILKSTVVGNSEVELNVWGIYTDGVRDTGLIFLTILVFVTVAVTFVNVFLYRRRWLQLRLCFAIGIMLVGILAFIGLYVYQLNSVATTQEFAAMNYSVSCLFPLLSLFLVWLAYRGVSADIALLRSLDRIR